MSDYKIIFESENLYYIKVNEKLMNDYLKMYNNKEIQKELFDKFINTVKEDAYIIKLNDKNIGFYNGEILDDGSYEIGNICIIPEYQGKGLGTRILKDIMESHKQQDLHIQYFKTNPVGKLYEKLGFVPDYEKEFHYVMFKEKQRNLKK